VLAVATRLGLTSFGGPVAHIGYFRDEYVARRRWLDEEEFADFVALSHLLPGPASSQVGIAIGAHRAGRPGALAAWIGFTLPSAVALVLFAYVVADVATADAGWLHGLEVVAVAVVARAVLQMARSLAPDVPRAAIALGAAGVALTWAGVLGQVTPIAAAAAVGAIAFRGAPTRASGSRVPVGRRLAVASLAVFAALLVALPVLRAVSDTQGLALVDSFYRSGSLVFGGGHVVLPLLHAEVVEPGWVSEEDFVAGYGAAQAIPGPLFTFSAYLGAVMGPEPDGVPGAALALGAIFLPSFLLVAGTLPLLGVLRTRRRFAGALRGVNAAVVGLLLAALYDPVWKSAIDAPVDVLLAAALLVLLSLRVPPWAVVPIAAGAGAILL
jgi:chromate transporter